MKKPALHKQLSAILDVGIAANDVGVRGLSFSVQPGRIVANALILSLGVTQSGAETDARSLFANVYDRVKKLTMQNSGFAEIGHSAFGPSSLDIYVGYDDGYDHFFVGKIAHDCIEWDQNANMVLNWAVQARPSA